MKHITKFFGNDSNTFSATVKSRYLAWGTWLSNTIGFDGYRLDFVRGFQKIIAAQNNSKSGRCSTICGMSTGVLIFESRTANAVASYGGADVGFDFPLKSSLIDV